MNLNEYQTETAIYTEKDECFKDLGFCGVALAEEAGEVCGKIKRLYRDHYGELVPSVREGIAAELGDVLFCVMTAASCIGMTGQELIDRSARKMHDRAKRGVQHGSGDNR